MTTLHATPYNRDASGFYFVSAEEFEENSQSNFDRYGNLVEEFEIQFIDGDDAELFDACGVNQSNLNIWFDQIACLLANQKASLFYLTAVLGYDVDQALEKLDEPIVYEGQLLDAASELFDECYLHTLPDNLKHYIDYEKFARDCQISGDMCEFKYAGQTYTCTNASAV